MQTLYLDWNVFNKLEHLEELPGDEQLIYHQILDLIQQKRFAVPYSNAHMSDLYRGYVKNPVYSEGHLRNISNITSDLCIVQYWGEPKVKWHYRDPQEFFESTKEDAGFTSASFSALFDEFDDDPLIQTAWELQKMALRWKTLPDTFRQVYSFDPFFSVMFPKTKTEMNQLALCEDMYDFGVKIKSDFALYKNYRKFLNDLRLKMPEYQKLYTNLQNKVIGMPQHLTWDAMWENADSIFEKKNKSDYDKIVNLFTTTDLKGYRQDEKFANLIDDALHCFYGHNVLIL